MTVFHPKLIVIESDNITMQLFKEMVAETLFGVKNTHGNSFVSHNTNGVFEIDKLKLYTFTGMEICDDEELSILENNTYLFASQGNNLL